jgi:hypothetical protein
MKIIFFLLQKTKNEIQKKILTIQKTLYTTIHSIHSINSIYDIVTIYGIEN